MKALLPIIIIALSVFNYETALAQKKKKEKKDEGYSLWLQEREAVGIPMNNGRFFYEVIDSVNAKDISKGDLVTAFKASLAQVLNKAKLAIDVEDREGGLVVAKIFDTYKGLKTQKELKETIYFNARDGRFRIQITDIEIGSPGISYNGSRAVSETYFESAEAFEKRAMSYDNYKKLSTTSKKESIDAKLRLNQAFLNTLESLRQKVVFNANQKF